MLLLIHNPFSMKLWTLLASDRISAALPFLFFVIFSFLKAQMLFVVTCKDLIWAECCLTLYCPRLKLISVKKLQNQYILLLEKRLNGPSPP